MSSRTTRSPKTKQRTMAALVAALQTVAIATVLTLTQPASAQLMNLSQLGGSATSGTLGPRPPGSVPETVPNAPILSSRWKTKSEVMLNFLDVSKVEAGFKLEQRRPGGPWQVVAPTLGPLGGQFVNGRAPASYLEPKTEYCFRVVAFNAAGESPSNEVCVLTTYDGACEADKLEEVLGFAESASDPQPTPSVAIDCDLYLEPSNIVYKRLKFIGSDASGVTVDLNGATLDGRGNPMTDGKDMIEVRSEELVVRDVENAISSYGRPEKITIRNGTVYGSIRLWGMSKNGEGDGDSGLGVIGCGGLTTQFPCNIDRTNQFGKSSRLLGHTERAQGNAPTEIVLQRLTIYGFDGRSPVYFAPGVTNSQLIDSHVLGYSDQVAIYLDAESAGNTFKGNVIDVATGNGFWTEARPLVAIDGSARNHFINNWFSNLKYGGIYFYRNCGEGGVIRHQTPSDNQVINNIFYYNEYEGDHPAVFLGSRNRGGLIGDLGFCENDAGFPFGSSASDEDFAKYNAIMQNQIIKRSVADMIRTQETSINTPNFIVENTSVTESAVENRPAGCYNGDGNAGFMEHGEAFTVLNGCSGSSYTCQDGELVSRPVNRCFVPTTSRTAVRLVLR